MLAIPKVMIFILIVISTIMFYASTNVCKYKFAVERKTNLLNIISEEIDPSIPKARVYYFKELNCNKVDFSFDYDRMIKNFKTLSVVIYQELSTDIRGNPN